ncbi:hypothetical protein [Citrobacter sp. wls613]|uniref:hypothetical protein n=1 Tax=Citrobacter sp. wls613 TaxID=2576436 RepID=UPI0010CA6680|nr:hypothetical protein [Citrobacter sp. wls613]TKV24820.1 hypothetical protein FDX01_00810 [Citrobacter sp. wls613]
MKIEFNATVTTRDEVVHNVYKDDKQIGFIIKTDRKNKPYHFVDMVGDSGNTDSLNKAVKNLCVKDWFVNTEKEKRQEVIAVILAMKISGELYKEKACNRCRLIPIFSSGDVLVSDQTDQTEM